MADRSGPLVLMGVLASDAPAISDGLPLPIVPGPSWEVPVDGCFAPCAVGSFTGSPRVVQDLAGAETILTRNVMRSGCDDAHRDGEC